MMDHENYFTPRNLNSVASEATIDFKEDVAEKRKAVPKQSRNPNRGFVVRDDGNPRTFKLGKKVKWSDFRIWPENVQEMYLRDIISKYPQITIANIAVMMGANACSLRYVNKKLGNVVTPSRRGGTTVKHDAEVNRFYNDFDCIDAASANKEKKKQYNKNYKNANLKKKENNKNYTPADGSVSVDSINMTLSFDIDTADIVAFLKAHGFSGIVTLTISKNIKNK